MRSTLFLSERVPNRDHRFGQGAHYFPCSVVLRDKRVPALFTADQVRVAMRRARDNPEDCPKADNCWQTLICYLFGGKDAPTD